MQPIVIVGAGMAGYTVARELRKLDKQAPLIIVTADHGGFYSKPMLSNAFAQNKQPEQLVTLGAPQMAMQLQAEILTRTRVNGIDLANRQLLTDDGPIGYGKLVLATGAQPIRLAIDGDAADQVLSINHVEDYAVFRERLALAAPTRVARIAILGAGLIGCEFADDLAGAGHAVTLIDPNPLPLAALAAPDLSQGLQAALLARGVMLQPGATARSIDRAAHGVRITLSNGGQVDADLVLSAVGLRADLTLAKLAGLQTGRGILVNAYGQTSASGIFALGDCAEYTLGDNRTGTLPYIAPLMSAARAIARSLAGTPTTIDLPPAPVIVKTPSYPLALLPPPLGAQGTWQGSVEEARTVCRFFDAEGIVRGFGVAPQEASVRQSLLAELGKPARQAAA